MNRSAPYLVPLAALCLLATAWLLLSGGPAPGAEPATRTDPAAERVADGALRPPPVPGAPTSLVREAEDVTAPPPTQPDRAGAPQGLEPRDSSEDMTLFGLIEINGLPVLGGEVAPRPAPGAALGPAVEISAVGTFELPLSAQVGRILIHVRTRAFSSFRDEPLEIDVGLSLDVQPEELATGDAAGPTRIERTFDLDFAFVDVTVREAGGGPIPGARVSCGGSRRVGGDHRADADGRILHAVWVVGPSRSGVNASAPGFTSSIVPFRLDPNALDQTVDVELQRAIPVAGTWTGLHSLLEERDRCRWLFYRDTKMTGFCEMPKDGNFEFEDFLEGTYRIDVVGPERAVTHRAELEVPAGGGTDLRLDFQPL